MRKLLIIVLFLGVFYAQADNSWSKVYEMAKKFELATMTKPDWAAQNTPPLFSAVWFTDLHITNAKTRDINQIAFNTARDIIKPNFALITGDNIGYSGKMTPAEKKLPKDQRVPKSLRNQLWLKRFLEKELALPYHIIPGDNWPKSFEEVFGPTHYSFDFGGYHFQFHATDITCKNTDGCCIFTPESLAWMEKDFAAASNRPCLFILHEPLWPPTFLDANKAAEILNRNPQVIGALSGHLHLDLQFPRGHWRQIIAPSTGRSHRPGFKKMLFYPDLIVLEAWEWDAEKKEFHAVPKWERLVVPEQFRPVSPSTPLTVENYASLPPAPKKEDPELASRAKEIHSNLLSFMVTFGLKQFLPSP